MRWKIGGTVAKKACDLKKVRRRQLACREPSLVPPRSSLNDATRCQVSGHVAQPLTRASVRDRTVPTNLRVPSTAKPRRQRLPVDLRPNPLLMVIARQSRGNFFWASRKRLRLRSPPSPPQSPSSEGHCLSPPGHDEGARSRGSTSRREARWTRQVHTARESPPQMRLPTESARRTTVATPGSGWDGEGGDGSAGETLARPSPLPNA